MHLVLLRHTRTAIASSVCYGNHDVPLADSASSDVAKAITKLPAIDKIYSSPLTRCKILATSLGEDRKLDVQFDDRLIEMNFGRWQGQAWDELPRQQLDNWANDFLYAKPHGGENVAELRSRSRSFLIDLSQLVDAKEQVAIVTHAGVIRSMLAVLENKDERESHIDYGESVCVTNSIKR